MTIKKEKQKNKSRAIFLDRDGVINRVITHDGKSRPPWSIDEFEILPGVEEACAMLEQAGYVLVVATNQPDVGRGDLSKEIVEEIHTLMLKHLPIDLIKVCYHPGRGQSNCDCRKPLPGMLLHASKELGLDLEQSWMIGDRSTDIECGHSAGCKTILIGNSYNEIMKIVPDFNVQSLQEAVTIILK